MQLLLRDAHLSFQWIPLGAYPDMPLRQWLFSMAHDDASWFWRILGLEINIVRSDG